MDPAAQVLSPPSELARHPRAVILVEGMSDKIVVETLAARQGRDLKLENVTVLSMSGAHAIGRYLARFVRAAMKPSSPACVTSAKRTCFGPAWNKADWQPAHAQRHGAYRLLPLCGRP